MPNEIPKAFQFEREKLQTIEAERGCVADPNLAELRAEALGYLGDRESNTWKSIETSKGRLIEPTLDNKGNVSAISDHTELEILQAIVCIERWHSAKRSAGSKKAAITRKHNAIKMKQFSALLQETKHPSREQIIKALTIDTS